MRHRHGHRKLGRTTSHRKALLKNMSISLVKYEKIETTVFKAKELKSYFEKLVTKARIGDPVTHRIVFASLQDKEATKKLVNEIAPRYKDRTGGYLKITKTRIRRGDATLMATLELI